MLEFAQSQKAKTRMVNTLKFAIGMVITCIVVGPLLITLFASLKTSVDMVSTSPLLPPSLETLTFENIIKVSQDKLLPYAIMNTTIITVVSVFFNVIIGSVTAYVLERFKFPGRNLIFILFFVGMMIPTTITEIARFKVIQAFGFYNTLKAPIFIYIASDLTQLYIYRQFISKLSVSLDESALIDGCSYFTLFRTIIFPLLAPATATLVIVKSIGIINDMYVPYLYMPSSKLKTMTTFLMAYADAESGSWQKLSAAVVLIMIPTFIIYVLFQKKIMDGLAAGAVKE